MGKENVTHTHTHTHTHTEEYYSAIKNEIFAICNNMDGPGEYYVRWNKSDREGQILHSILYTWNLKHTIN